MDTPRTSRAARPSRGPLRRLLDVISSIWTGMAILALLFVYSFVGSVGLWPFTGGAGMVRQWPMFEMTEYEWFHAWPFELLIGLLCACLALATVRRIPLRPVNFGVWMIHVGIVMLSLSCVWYFSTKLEGDAPVIRRQLVARLPGYEPVGVVAMPGNQLEIGPPEDPYRIQVGSIDPSWEILSGDDKGTRAYSVNVNVQGPQGPFIRQLIDGFPQYTEDLVRSPEPGGPPLARAAKVLGDPIVDDVLQLELAYQPQEWFYLSNDIAKSWAIYVREVAPDGTPGPWFERPVDGLPLYNDYLADLADVWPGPGPGRPRALDVEVPAAEDGDPMPDRAVRIRSYLRYAAMETRRHPGGDVFDPLVRVRVDNVDGRTQEYELVALDEQRKGTSGGAMVFEWAPDQAAFEALAGFREPMLRVRVPGTDVERDVPIRAMSRDEPDLPFTPIDASPYEFRVQTVHNDVPLQSGEVISVAVVEIRSPDRSFVRWVADDPDKTRDLPDPDATAAAHMQPLPLDTSFEMTFEPGDAPPPILIVTGPGENALSLVLTTGEEGTKGPIPLAVGQAVEVNDQIELRVLSYAPETRLVTRPLIAAPEQRNPDVRARMSMVQVDVPAGAGTAESHWLHYHEWPIPDASHGMGRIRFRPTEIALDDGRTVELMFSRQRHALPAPVVLDDFAMKTHVGGFTGQNISILNWTSSIRFRDGEGWTPPMQVSVNDPAAWGGFSYFQAAWDPPDAQSGYRGLNYTVLGVGNRHGVNAMLLGCCLMCAGMIYAFYVKPIIKRRRLEAARAGLPAARRNGELAGAPRDDERVPQAVPAAGEERA